MEKEQNLIKLGPMSECSVAGNAEAQKRCRFREKSTGSEECMHCVMDDNCDSLKAQMKAEEALKKGEANTNLQKDEATEVAPEVPKEAIETEPAQPEKKVVPSGRKISFE